MYEAFVALSLPAKGHTKPEDRPKSLVLYYTFRFYASDFAPILKGILNMIQLFSENFHDVEAKRLFLMGQKPIRGDLSIRLPLFTAHRLGGHAVGIRAPRLDLDKDELFFPNDKVGFSKRRSVIFLHEGIARSLQVSEGGSLSSFSENFAEKVFL